MDHALHVAYIIALLTAALSEPNKENRDDMILRAIEGIKLM